MLAELDSDTSNGEDDAPAVGVAGDESPPSSSPPPPPIGVGLLGFSASCACALHHLWLRPDAFSVVGYCTPEPEERLALTDFSRLAGGPDCLEAQFVDDADDLLQSDDIQLLILGGGSPHRQSELARRSAKAGKHCVCSYPPPVGAQPPLAGDSPLSLVAASYRFLPAVHRLKSCLHLVGDLFAIRVSVSCPQLVGRRYDWSCDPLMGGGALQHYGAIFIDVAQFLLDSAPLRARGELRTYQPQTESICGIRTIRTDQLCSFELQFANGVWLHAWLDSLASEYSHTVELIGKSGRLTLHDCQLTLDNELLLSDPLTDADLLLLRHVEAIAGMPQAQFLSPMLPKSASGLVDLLASAIGAESGAGDDCTAACPSLHRWAGVQRAVLAVRHSSQLGRWVAACECESPGAYLA